MQQYCIFQLLLKKKEQNKIFSNIGLYFAKMGIKNKIMIYFTNISWSPSFLFKLDLASLSRFCFWIPACNKSFSILILFYFSSLTFLFLFFFSFLYFSSLSFFNSSLKIFREFSIFLYKITIMNKKDFERKWIKIPI